MISVLRDGGSLVGSLVDDVGVEVAAVVLSFVPDTPAGPTLTVRTATALSTHEAHELSLLIDATLAAATTFSSLASR